MVDKEPKNFKYFIFLCYFSHRVSKVLKNQQKIGIMLRIMSDKIQGLFKDFFKDKLQYSSLRFFQ